MKNKLAVAAAIAAMLGTLAARAGTAAQLQYVVIVTRHGVRPPTSDNSRLEAYAAAPWPAWDAPPGDLTPHGRTLMKLMGAYYREWLESEHLPAAGGCANAARIHIHADKDERTVETGRALAETLAPGCGLVVEARADGASDPLFSGAGSPDPERMRKAVEERMGPDPQKLLAAHRAALDALDAVLWGTARKTGASEEKIVLSAKGKSVQMEGPLATGSSLSEDLLLEYAEGMTGTSLGWGRLTAGKLREIMEIHTAYADLMRRTPYLAKAHGSNLLAHVLASLEQAAAGKAAAGALDHPGEALLVLCGHDTNLSNLSGMMGLTWELPGYQRDDTPPGGALIFSLWKDSGGEYVKLRYVAQTLEQMRNTAPLSVATPPAGQDVAIPGCRQTAWGGCPWAAAEAAMRGDIDPEFVSLAPAAP
ncbi:MAG TPA: histidine-type phosphatase [Bryobacteraceae bacterium]|nr:histidine-type phosphatase [Bryobacteraceae bacterium]